MLGNFGKRLLEMVKGAGVGRQTRPMRRGKAPTLNIKSGKNLPLPKGLPPKNDIGGYGSVPPLPQPNPGRIDPPPYGMTPDPSKIKRYGMTPRPYGMTPNPRPPGSSPYYLPGFAPKPINPWLRLHPGNTILPGRRA